MSRMYESSVWVYKYTHMGEMCVSEKHMRVNVWEECMGEIYGGECMAGRRAWEKCMRVNV